MLFEEVSLDTDIKLNEVGCIFDTEKYIIHCAEYDGNHTIHMQVCIHAEGNAFKERLFDALENIAATKLLWRVGLSENASVEHNQENTELNQKDRRKEKPLNNVVVLRTCKAFPPQNKGIVLLVLPAGGVEHEHEENCPSLEQVGQEHAQTTDDLTFENRNREERSYNAEHGVILDRRFYDNLPRIVSSPQYPARLTDTELSPSEEDDEDLSSQLRLTPHSENAHSGLRNDGQQSVTSCVFSIPNGAAEPGLPRLATFTYTESQNNYSSPREGHETTFVDSRYNNAEQSSVTRDGNFIPTPNLISSPPVEESRARPNNIVQICNRQLTEAEQISTQTAFQVNK